MNRLQGLKLNSSKAHDLLRGPTALYAQVASIIRSQLKVGTWQAGAELPSIDELCESYNVSRITVRQAIQTLVTEGLLISQRGRRVIVSSRAGPVLAEKFRDVIDPLAKPQDDHEITVLERTDGVALPDGVCFFGKPTSAYVRLRKVHRESGVPYCAMEMYVDQSLFDSLPRGIEKREKLAPLLYKRGKRTIARGRERIIVAAADFEEAQLLEYPMAGPVARMTRILCNINDNAVYYGCFTYRGDRFGVERESGPYVKQPWEQLRKAK